MSSAPHEAEPLDDQPSGLAARLRELREARGYSVRELAKRSGVPASTISKIENGRLSASLVTAIGLANALDENLGFLAGQYRSSPEPVVVVRSGQRATIDYPDMGLTLQDLNGRFMPGLLEARVGILRPGASSGQDTMTHPGEEFCCVIAGEIRYRIGHEELTLASGEYVQFKCSVPHAWENVSGTVTRVIWVFSEGLSF